MFDDGRLDDPTILERFDPLLRTLADAGARVAAELIAHHATS